MQIVIYMSRAVKPLRPSELTELGEQAAASNRQTGITGLLLHDGRRFMQALEGPRDAVRALIAEIEKDPRHHQISFFLDERTEERQFAGWAMRTAALESGSPAFTRRAGVGGLVERARAPRVKAAFLGFAATGR